jgi:hypothetical protein
MMFLARDPRTLLRTRLAWDTARLLNGLLPTDPVLGLDTVTPEDLGFLATDGDAVLLTPLAFDEGTLIDSEPLDLQGDGI